MVDENGNGTPDLVVEFPVEFYGSIDARGLMDVVTTLQQTYDQVRVSIATRTATQGAEYSRGTPAVVMSCFNVAKKVEAEKGEE
jgi:hypothetical protein